LYKQKTKINDFSDQVIGMIVSVVHMQQKPQAMFS